MYIGFYIPCIYHCTRPTAPSLSLLDLPRSQLLFITTTPSITSTINPFPCVFLLSAHPSQPEIFLNVAARSHDDLVLTCRTSGYYPPGIAISWHSNDVVLADPGPLETWKSEHGDFQASRHLVLPATYGANLLTVSCIVQHISLPAPLYANYSHSESRSSGKWLRHVIAQLCLQVAADALSFSAFSNSIFFYFFSRRFWVWRYCVSARSVSEYS